jgi:hypothetical protein
VRTRPASKSATSLEPQALEAIERFVASLARCGASPPHMARAFADACAAVPKSRARKAGRAAREMSAATHLLTLWFSDPRYLDGEGKPVALPVQGPSPSLATLVRRVDPALDPREVVRYLRRNRALRKVGRAYRPAGPALVFGGNLRGLLAMLRTFEHNTVSQRPALGWFERYAENPAFPKRARALLDAQVRRHGMKFLRRMDSHMHRAELKRRAGEPIVRIGVGVYRFEEAIAVPENPRRRARPKGRKEV